MTVDTNHLMQAYRLVGQTPWSAAGPLPGFLRRHSSSILILLLATISHPLPAASPDTYTPVQRRHWSFQPLSPTPASSIDSFLRSRLKKEGLTPAPPASPRTLIRRVFLDV